MNAVEVSLDFQSFSHSVTELCVSTDSVIQRTMDLLFLVIYSPATKMDEVDFDAFTMEDGLRAYEELYHYHPDDVSDELEDEAENKENLLVEINRICHMANIASSLQSRERKRRFF